MVKVAFITGITGQDGSYLAELLLEKGYVVYGLVRRSSSFNTGRIDHIFDKLQLHHGDITDTPSLVNVLTDMKKQNAERYEIYNLGSQTHVKVSFETPQFTGQVNAMGTLNLLEALRMVELPNTRFYQASTSELYGLVQEIPQKETTPFYPRSPYGVAKLYAFWIVKNYREAYDMFAVNGILFNHESPRRGETFVTRKITRGISDIVHGRKEFITLGNINSKRDWSHAKDCVYAMWLMLNSDKPDDYVIASGEQRTVREFVEIAFAHKNMKITWEGEGIDEVGRDQNGVVRIKIDPKYFRPTEVESLLGDPSKAKKELGWNPQYTFDELVKEMIDSDCEN